MAPRHDAPPWQGVFIAFVYAFALVGFLVGVVGVVNGVMP